MYHFGGGEGGRLVGVGGVDGDVERLIGYLPEEGAGCLSDIRSLVSGSALDEEEEY